MGSMIALSRRLMIGTPEVWICLALGFVARIFSRLNFWPVIVRAGFGVDLFSMAIAIALAAFGMASIEVLKLISSHCGTIGMISCAFSGALFLFIARIPALPLIVCTLFAFFGRKDGTWHDAALPQQKALSL